MREVRKVRVIQADGRGRVSLKKFTNHELHTVDVDADGTLTLTPVVILPREATEKVDEFLDNPSTGIRVARKEAWTPRGPVPSNVSDGEWKGTANV